MNAAKPLKWGRNGKAGEGSLNRLQLSSALPNSKYIADCVFGKNMHWKTDNEEVIYHKNPLNPATRKPQERFYIPGSIPVAVCSTALPSPKAEAIDRFHFCKH